MRTVKIVVVFLMTTALGLAQNEQDALRYSQLGINGTSRFNAMGGAFGALGADLSCAAYNPAGLAIYRKSDFSYSANIRVRNNTVTSYNQPFNYFDAQINFNHIGLLGVFKSATDVNGRTAFGITMHQYSNFNNSIKIQGYTNNSSIAKDMLNIAEQKGQPSSLNSYYEGLGFSTYLLDTFKGKFFSFLDTKRTVKQTRDINTLGRQKEVNISLAHTFDDNFYMGVSIGIPTISFTSTTTHKETDDLDSMRVVLGPNKTYTTSYINGLPVIYENWLGFSSLSYTEYFRTNGKGFNVKLGGIYRLNDMLRLGFNYCSRSYYNLTDVYYNKMSVTFDKAPSNPSADSVPRNKGYYKYKLITPSRIGLSAALIYKKLWVFSMDYEAVNYSKAQLNGANAYDFQTANNVIKTNYTLAHNLKVGAELNSKPVIFRAGYNMQGSPYGDVFTGNYVRNTISLGVGFKTTTNFYLDFAWFNTVTKEEYNMLKTINTKSTLVLINTSLALTVGKKF